MGGADDGRAAGQRFILHLDTSCEAALIRVGIPRSRILIEDLDTLDIEGVTAGRRWNRSLPTTPRIVMVRISCIPKTETDFHRTLRVLIVGSLAIGGFESAHVDAINVPYDSILVPVNSVGVETRHWL